MTYLGAFAFQDDNTNNQHPNKYPETEAKTYKITTATIESTDSLRVE
ncbi:hypothetical protein [Mariniflexile sp. AS56]|nr:hypothetical protein [Mariniflexile sp. AS56]MDO7174201.1 hypothetical protein [Mariniflexile sp. AS56]